MAITEKLLSTDQVALILNVSRETVIKWTLSGMLTGYKIGRRLYRYKREDVDALLSNSKNIK